MQVIDKKKGTKRSIDIVAVAKQIFSSGSIGDSAVAKGKGRVGIGGPESSKSGKTATGTKATTVSASIARGTGMEHPSSGQSSGQ